MEIRKTNKRFKGITSAGILLSEEMGALLGVSYQRVNQIEKRAIYKLFLFTLEALEYDFDELAGYIGISFEELLKLFYTLFCSYHSRDPEKIVKITRLFREKGYLKENLLFS